LVRYFKKIGDEFGNELESICKKWLLTNHPIRYYGKNRKCEIFFIFLSSIKIPYIFELPPHFLNFPSLPPVLDAIVFYRKNCYETVIRSQRKNG
jgi:hypothetical protein